MTGKLPKYTDDEVRVFHPILEEALNKALVKLEIKDKYEVIHHKGAGTVIADFAIQNKSNDKIILFLEVKRKPGDVSSTRYRNQAKMYVEESRGDVEKPYYVLTNLEVMDFFKYNPKRISVLQQLLEPSPIVVGSFCEDKYDNFFDKLVSELIVIIKIVLDDLGQYKNNTIELFEKLKTKFDDKDYWHNLLLTSCYEYIRGSFSQSKKLQQKITKWAVATYYKPNIEKVSRLGLSVNFKDIFELDKEIKEEKDFWNSEILKDIFTAGRIRRTGEDIANIIHEIVQEKKKPEGFISTDPELARLLIAISKKTLSNDFSKEDMIFDPGAGIGNLLSAVHYEFEEIEPKQIWANEIEEDAKEALSLILGLTYSNKISPENSPLITISDITKLEKESLKNVKLVVMNPPYISGVNSKEEKVKFSQRIEEITGSKSVLDIGQIGLEALFFELVQDLVPENSLTAAIIPKRYLTAQGKESKAFREYLLNRGDLRCIAFYPKEGIFEEVIKSTMIIIFEKTSKKSEEVKIVEIKIPLEQIDYNSILSEEDSYGMTQHSVKKDDLQRLIDNGWAPMYGIGEKFDVWLDSILSDHETLEEKRVEIIRGRVGNQGASNLCFVNSNKKTWSALKNLVPENTLKPAIRNSDKLITPVIQEDNTKDLFMDIADLNNDKNLEEIIKVYLDNSTDEGNKQKKKVKTTADIMNILKRESNNVTTKYTILVPRNIRRVASIGLCNCEKLFASTNFIELIVKDKEEATLLLSWLMSVYGQLQFEKLCNDQEGARKVEKEHVKKIRIPNFNNIDSEIKKELIEETEKSDFIDLYKIKKRKIDTLWTKVLEDKTKRSGVYDEANEFLEDFVQERRLNT